MSTTVPKLKFSEPRRNLPRHRGLATEEDRFTIAFARAYVERLPAIHSQSAKSRIAVAREIPVNGYGIADLVAVAWEPKIRRRKSVEEFLSSGAVTTRAFECKMKDWRAALAQAVRYRYFAHQSIVVLPFAACERALPLLETFKKTRIGLWAFDQLENRIKVFHTPRSSSPKSEKYLVQSVELVHRATSRSLPIA